MTHEYKNFQAAYTLMIQIYERKRVPTKLYLSQNYLDIIRDACTEGLDNVLLYDGLRIVIVQEEDYIGIGL